MEDDDNVNEQEIFLDDCYELLGFSNHYYQYHYLNNYDNDDNNNNHNNDKIDVLLSEKDVKNAYYHLALQYHPDRHFDANIEDKKKAEMMFKKLKHAYDMVLEDIKKIQEQNGQYRQYNNDDNVFSFGIIKKNYKQNERKNNQNKNQHHYYDCELKSNEKKTNNNNNNNDNYKKRRKKKRRKNKKKFD